MKICWHLAISALIVMTFWAAIAGAETRYVSDQLVVALREQPRQSAQSITYLKTDMAVKILEETGEYIKIQTEAGEIGYIKQNYLTPNTPKTAIIKQLQRENDRLTNKVKEIQRQIEAATSQGDKSQQELASQLAENNRQISDLENKFKTSQASLASINRAYQKLQKDAKGVIEITKERVELRATNQELTTAVTSLKDEVESLTMTGIIKWFLAGGGVLLLGWIIGKLSGGRRRSSF
jgi:SH3 domain protein